VRKFGVPTALDRFIQQAYLRFCRNAGSGRYPITATGFDGHTRHSRAPARAQQYVTEGYRRVVDLDLEKLLDASSHYTSRCFEGVEEVVSSSRYLYSQAFCSAAVNVNGLKLAALYTLQDSLPRHAQQPHGFVHLHVTVRRGLNKQRTQLVVDTDTPRRTGRHLFACNEAIVEPAMQGGRRELECAGGFLDGHTLTALRLLLGFEARDLPVRSQATHAIGRERQPSGRCASLSIEDAGYDSIGVKRGQASQQIDRIIGGADGRRMRARQRNIDLGEESAAPMQRQMRVVLLTLHFQRNIVEQRAQQLLAIAITRGVRRPDTLEIFAEREDRVAFLARDGAWSRVLSFGELVFSGLQFLQSVLPLSLKPARDQSVLRIHGAIAPLGTLCVVPRTLDVAAELHQGRFVIGFKLLDRLEQGFQACWCERGEKGLGNCRVNLDATHIEAVLAATIHDVLACAMIPRCRVSAGVVHGEAPSAMSTNGDALQECCPFSHGAATVMRLGADILPEALLVRLEVSQSIWPT